MAREFLIKDIAFQAGLSTATVDRVINDRGGVRRQTEAQVYSRLEPLLDGLVSAADDSLEGGDHIADHIFGCIMQQRHQAIAGCGVIEVPEDGFNNETMLRN